MRGTSTWRRTVLIHRRPVRIVVRSSAAACGSPSTAADMVDNRLRAGIQGVPWDSSDLRIMAYPVSLDGERPRIRKSFTTAALADMYGLQQLRDLAAQPGVAPYYGRQDHVFWNGTEIPHDDTSHQHAVSFPFDDDETPVIAFIHLRIIPVLRHIGWLPKAAA